VRFDGLQVDRIVDAFLLVGHYDFFPWDWSRFVEGGNVLIVGHDVLGVRLKDC